MKSVFRGAATILLICLLISACDKGKKPYEEAEALFNKSDYGAAKSKAAGIIQIAPNSKYLPHAQAIVEKVDKIESLSKLAVIYIEKGDYEKGIESYNEILSVHSDNKIITGAKHDAEITMLRLERLASELIGQLDTLQSAVNIYNQSIRYGEVSSAEIRYMDATADRARIESAKYREKATAIYKIPGGYNYMKLQFKKSGIDEKYLPAK